VVQPPQEHSPRGGNIGGQMGGKIWQERKKLKFEMKKKNPFLRSTILMLLRKLKRNSNISDLFVCFRIS